MKKNYINSVFVLGSTSEIARSIIFELAYQGCKKFHLVARDPYENEKIAIQLKKFSSVQVSLQETDLFNSSEINSQNNNFIDDFDLYLIAAGYLGDTQLANVDYREALKITNINYSGLLKWITNIVTPSRILKSGRLWILSSVSSDRGRPSNYHYGASKAALNVFCEGIFLRCVNKPFSVRIIKAGFVYTRMSKDIAPRSLSISPKLAAKHLLRKPNKRGFEYLPWWWFFIMRIIKSLPPSFAAKI
tara:strand:- start:11246 stop:11983 length:738 start_codon:yes stop_codon:yes gene_type:complete